MHIQPEKIPFTCAATQKYCGADIRNLYIMIDNTVLTTVPISPEIAEKINRTMTKKASNIILQDALKRQT